MRGLLGVLSTAVLSLAMLTGLIPLAQAEADLAAGARDRSPACSSERQTVTVTADAGGLHVNVLHLVVLGLHDSAIAARLTISPRSVHAHLRSIFKKLHVDSRTAAAHEAVKLDLG